MCQNGSLNIPKSKFKPLFKQEKRYDLEYHTYAFNMVVCTGFEPVSVALRGQCVKPLHQQTNCLYSLAQTLKEINIRLPAKYKILDSLSH